MTLRARQARIIPLGALVLAAAACATPSTVLDEPVPQQEVEPTFTGQQDQPVEAAGDDSSGDIGEFEVPVEGFDHIEPGTQADYAHYPPSSGQHYPSPAAWGAYSEAIPPEVWVHNLEHSGVVVLYNCPDGCTDLVDALLDWARNAPPSSWGHQKIIISPNDLIETRLVALAWGWEMDLDEFDAQRLTAFYERHLDDGPEDVP